MATIKNSPAVNMYGDGHEKIIILDNGDEYVLRNTPELNMYGNGHKQELIKRDYNHNNYNDKYVTLIVGIGALLAMGILWLIAENFHIFL